MRTLRIKLNDSLNIKNPMLTTKRVLDVYGDFEAGPLMIYGRGWGLKDRDI